MAYTITLRIAQQSRDHFNVVEKTCNRDHVDQVEWTETQGCHELYMGASGASGMLRLKSQSGETFCLAMGIHNFVRWCDIVVDLKDDSTAQSIHPGYYRPGGAQELWNQLSEITKITARGVKLKLEFTRKEGTKLSATLMILKPLNLLSLGMQINVVSSKLAIANRANHHNLDGGGVRGLSALLSLATLMRNLNDKRQGGDDLKPCDVFDLIGGTGTGGFVFYSVFGSCISNFL